MTTAQSPPWKVHSKTVTTQIPISIDVVRCPALPTTTISDCYKAKIVQSMLREYCTAHIYEKAINPFLTISNMYKLGFVTGKKMQVIPWVSWSKPLPQLPWLLLRCRLPPRLLWRIIPCSPLHVSFISPSCTLFILIALFLAPLSNLFNSYLISKTPSWWLSLWLIPMTPCLLIQRDSFMLTDFLD